MFNWLVILSFFAAACALIPLKRGVWQNHIGLGRQHFNPLAIGGYSTIEKNLILNYFCISHESQVKMVSVIESISYFFMPSLPFYSVKKTTWRKAKVI